VNVGLHAVIEPVRSAKVAALVGHVLHTLVPGLKDPSEQSVIATHFVAESTGVSPLQAHLPVDGLSILKVESHNVHAPVGPSQVVQFYGHV
jgi:hypothetical protein